MLTVSSLNTKIKSLLEATFMHTMVEGEVASVTYHTSGHLYFSIKDDKSSIKCIMWRSSVAKMKFRIEKGMHIVVEGSVSVYTPRGEYQFQTVKIEPYGQGALALAYEQLKEKLKAKGYFDAQRKKSIPKVIRKIVLVTAKESAALHDMLKIIEKRWPLVEVVIVDTLVQGESAVMQIARSLRFADTLNADVVIVGRGGGSVEDLWAFNEEAVADAIFAMRTPVVSAVGHEVDVLISDHVADLRAPTPSAAIEMILPDRYEVLLTLDEMQERFRMFIRQRVLEKVERMQYLEALLKQQSPLRKLMTLSQLFTSLEGEYQRLIRYQIQKQETQLPHLRREFDHAISMQLERKRDQLQLLETRIKQSDPKLQCKEGWGKLSKDGHKIALRKLHENERFTIEDADVRVEAVCLSKKEI